MRVLAGLLAILALLVATPSTASAATSTTDLEHDLLDMINDCPDRPWPADRLRAGYAALVGRRVPRRRAWPRPTS